MVAIKLGILKIRNKPHAWAGSQVSVVALLGLVAVVQTGLFSHGSETRVDLQGDTLCLGSSFHYGEGSGSGVNNC
jgi:drug/metabolite transporter (DMT)-like permease